MKVADLIDDLETGDRSMEHLKSTPESAESFVDALRQTMDRLTGLPQSIGASGFGLGNLQSGQQQSLNNLYNQQLSNMQAMQGMPNINITTNRTWNGGL